MGTRVFVLWDQQLFFEAVQALLQHPSIEVVGDSSEYAVAQATINSLEPDIILIEAGGSTTHSEMETLNILRTSSWNPRVIRLSPRDNDMVVYRREQRSIDQIADLLSLIQEK